MWMEQITDFWVQVLNVQVPILFKQAIDALNVSGETMVVLPMAALLGCRRRRST